MPLAESLDIDFVEKCDVTSDEQIEATFARAKETFGKIDILVHSIAYAPSEDIGGRFRDVSRDGSGHLLRPGFQQEVRGFVCQFFGSEEEAGQGRDHD